MGIGRHVLVAAVAATLAASACSAASGADRVALEPAAPSATSSSAPAAGLLPRVDAGSSGLRSAVDEAIVATHDRVAAAERRAQEAARRSEDPDPAGAARATSDAGCAQRAMAAGQFDPSCAAYQGYLDPGTSAGRAPTSGEVQLQYACEQGLVPEDDC